MISVNAGDTAPDDSNAAYSSGKLTAIIPAGFTVSGTEGETSIENGLVVRDGNQNEWVWIPVERAEDLYEENSTNASWIMCGTSGNSAVVTKYVSKSGVLSGITRTTSGITNNCREPDTVVGDGTQYDAVENNRKVAGFVESDGITASSLETMAKVLRDDYKKMLDSVKKYGGFYVGRYELSNIGIQKNQNSLTKTNWYDLYAKCKTLGSHSGEARMIWGCQWDQVCKFISNYKDENGTKTRSIADSRTYGNYSNSIEPANTGNYQQNRIKQTGSNETWKTNNIYDLAGNCWEWTQEAYGTNNRAARGGRARK